MNIENSYTSITKMEHRATQKWQRSGFAVIECIDCGFKHLFPFPTKSELELFYRERYHREKWQFPYDTINEEHISIMLKGLQFNRNYQSIFKEVSNYLPKDAPRCMADIGGGNSLLAPYFMLQGWRSLVIEPSREAAEYLRRFDIEVVESMFEDLDISLCEQFSYINMQHVLEHIIDPLEMLKCIAKLMPKGALIRVCVPNDFSPGQRAWLTKSRVDPPWISYPDHVNYFNFDSLSKLLQRAGLKEVSRSTSFPLEFFLLTGTDYYLDENLQKKIGPAISNFENSWIDSGQGQDMEILYTKLAELGLGRNAIMYATIF